MTYKRKTVHIIVALMLAVFLISGQGCSIIDMETPVVPNGKKLAPNAVKMKNNKSVYDITALLPDVEGMKLSDYGASGNDTVMLLYIDSKSSKDGIYSFKVLELNITDGSIKTVAENLKTEKSCNTDEDKKLRFVSLSPLIIIDYFDGTVYYTEQEKAYNAEIDVPQEANPVLVDAVMTYRGIICIGSNGYAYAVCQDIMEGEAYTYTWMFWQPPVNYRVTAIEQCLDKYIVFGLERLNTEEADDLHVMIKLDEYNEELYSTPKSQAEYIYCVNSSYNVTCAKDEIKGNELAVTLSNGKQYMSSLKSGDIFSNVFKSNAKSISMSDFAYNSESLFFKSNTFRTGGREEKETLYLWDLSQELPVDAKTAGHTEYKLAPVSDKDVKKLEKSIEKKYGVIVNTGKEVPDMIEPYKVEIEDSNENQYSMLTHIDYVFGTYPKGFFKQLGGNGNGTVTVNIMLSLVNTEDDGIPEAAGLTNGDTNTLSFASGWADNSSIYHEITHLIYAYFENSGIIFDFLDDLQAVNPPDFEYVYSYNNTSEISDEYTEMGSYSNGNSDSIYFINTYSKTYQTEDIAELMANLLGNSNVPQYYSGKHLQEKCKLLFKYIRDNFDTSGWKEKPIWERRLESVAG